jgi:hypothetical protein
LRIYGTKFTMATVEQPGKPTTVPEQEKTERIVKEDKVELQDADAWAVLGYSFPTWRKW